MRRTAPGPLRSPAALRRQRVVLALAAPLLTTAVMTAACNKVYVDDPLCLALTNEAEPPGASALAQLDCHVFWPQADAAVDPQVQFPNIDSTYQYSCVDPDDEGVCPSAEQVRASLDGCFASEEGELNPIGGYHEWTSTYSACGPDPAATGACCYHAFLVTSSVLSAVGNDSGQHR